MGIQSEQQNVDSSQFLKNHMEFIECILPPNQKTPVILCCSCLSGNFGFLLDVVHIFVSGL